MHQGIYVDQGRATNLAVHTKTPEFQIYTKITEEALI